MRNRLGAFYLRAGGPDTPVVVEASSCDPATLADLRQRAASRSDKPLELVLGWDLDLAFDVLGTLLDAFGVIDVTMPEHVDDGALSTTRIPSVSAAPALEADPDDLACRVIVRACEVTDGVRGPHLSVPLTHEAGRTFIAGLMVELGIVELHRRGERLQYVLLPPVRGEA